MNQLYEQMNERKAYLEKMQSEITKELEKMPSGKLRINNVCGIYPGKNLIITYEADGCFLNIKDVRKMVLEILRIM